MEHESGSRVVNLKDGVFSRGLSPARMCRAVGCPALTGAPASVVQPTAEVEDFPTPLKSWPGVWSSKKADAHLRSGVRVRLTIARAGDACQITTGVSRSSH